MCNLCYNLRTGKTGTYGQKSGTDFEIGSAFSQVFQYNNSHEKQNK